MQWFYVEDGRQAGPVDEQALAEMIQTGRITPETLVWCETMSKWAPYAEAMAARQAGGGVAVAEGAVRCAECGRLEQPEEMVQYEGLHVCAQCKPLFFQKIREGVQFGGQLNYAGFLLRVGGYIIDAIILWIAGMPIGWLISAASSDSVGLAMVGLSMLLNLTLAATYDTFFHGRMGATPGKMALGLRVVSASGERISYARALGRYFAEILSGMILGLGYLMAAFDDQKRALHDRICDTRVIRTR